MYIRWYNYIFLEILFMFIIRQIVFNVKIFFTSVKLLSHQFFFEIWLTFSLLCWWVRKRNKTKAIYFFELPVIYKVSVNVCMSVTQWETDKLTVYLVEFIMWLNETKRHPLNYIHNLNFWWKTIAFRNTIFNILKNMTLT